MSRLDRHAGQTLGPSVMVALLSAVAAALVLWGHQLMTRTEPSIPAEGFYWAVSQYQIAELQLKQELRAIAAGETVSAENLNRRAAVFASKASILTEPSEVRTLLSGVAGYIEATGRLAELQRSIGPVLEQKSFKQADARWVLLQIHAFDEGGRLSKFSSDMRLAEVGANEDLLSRLRSRMAWIGTGFVLCWGLMTLWLLDVLRSRRRYAASASQQARAVEAMGLAIADKRKFLNIVSHEVRSPLQSIVTAAESLAQEVCQQGSRPQGVAAIRRLRHAVSALQGQLRDLLTIARSDSDRLDIQLETFDLRDLVRDVCADLEDSAIAKGLTFQVSVSESPLTVCADPIRIAQLLRNLVENAVRYTDTGSVKVDLELAQAKSASPSGIFQCQSVPTMVLTQAASARFCVSDTGPGLPPEARQRLLAAAAPFEPHVDGTRIGLFVVRDVLHQLGGSLDVNIAPNAGTSLAVSIPVLLVTETAEKALSGAAGNVSARTATEALHILVVDDHQDVLTALSDMATHLGHMCDTAASAVQARTPLAAKPYDTVLIDLQMPGEDGLTLATKIRHDNGPNSQSMLILISAAENRAMGLQWPFDGFLEKPIDSESLSGLIGSRTPR